MRQSSQRRNWDVQLEEARERVRGRFAELYAEARFQQGWREPTFAEKHGSKVLAGVMLIVIPILAILGAVFDR